MNAIIVFCILSLLLVSGKILRALIPLFQKLYIPSSVIGGLLGLVIFSVFGSKIPAEWQSSIKMIPGFMINVIFAALFLGAVTPKLKTVFATAFPQICMGQMLAWGQYAIGLGLAGLVFLPLFGVNPAFGNLLEIGFQGGHGTVGGVSETFRSFKWEEGIALGYTVATFGMISGIIIGMIMVNWALKKGYVKEIRTFNERSYMERIGVYGNNERPSAGLQTVFCDSIDSLAFHVALIGIAILIGFGILKGLQSFEVFIAPNEKLRLFKGFPLFPLCMIGGVFMQMFLNKINLGSLVNKEQMQRLSGASLDFLVVSAVATIQLKAVIDNFMPLVILVVAGTIFCVVMVVFIAPKLLKKDWFEKAIAEFGQATGVTATGLMLLRTVDPENKTEAAASFGYKQLIHEPIMGGGLWTAFALTLVFSIGWMPIWIFSCVMLVVWGIIALIIIKRR
jgi:ESS family glutamate:Na+ symporter